MGEFHCLLKLGIVCLLSLSILQFVSGQQGEDDFPNEIPRISTGSCLTAGLCCPGRDSSCVVQKAPPNSIIEDLNDIPCYCDHGCVLLNDCCSDFKTACGVQDCEVSNWELWTPCDSDCGLGTMTRTRTIAIEARNGGKVCPSLVQKRGCRGTRCQHHRSRVSIEEAAIILPVEFSEKRKLNESSDITRNLRLRYPKNPAKERSSPYCVEFEVIRSTRACKSLESFISLREGNRICVMCEREAQRPYSDYRCAGTGSDNGIATRFSSLREPACHGKWKHIFSNSICGCGEGARFIFV